MTTFTVALTAVGLGLAAGLIIVGLARRLCRTKGTPLSEDTRDGYPMVSVTMASARRRPGRGREREFAMLPAATAAASTGCDAGGGGWDERQVAEIALQDQHSDEGD